MLRLVFNRVHAAGLPAASVITADNDRFEAIENTTLGFQKVFMINMPARSDKLDAFSLAAHFTRFSFQTIPGVDGTKVARKAVPAAWPGLEGPDATPSAAGALGCWRAHLNFVRQMVSDNIQSALIFEDDADWDLNLREQLKNFALGSQLLLGQIDNSTASPYGDGWDILWLGHCASSPKPDDPRRFLMRKDPTVPPRNRRKSLWGPDEELGRFDDHTRMVYAADTGICTYAYALSLSGARKVLQRLALGSTVRPIDEGLDNLCRNRAEDFDFQCISVYPTLVDSRRYSESLDNPDSDIQGAKLNFENGKRDPPFTHNIRFSARHNVPRLVQAEEVESQWFNEESEDHVLDGDVELEYILTKTLKDAPQRFANA